MRSLHYLTLALLSLFSINSFASSNLDLASHLTSKILAVDHAFTQASQEQRRVAPSPAGSEVEFKQFFLGFAATASFGIPNVLDIAISPEITFIWERVDQE